jgi:hypothetical protein
MNRTIMHTGSGPVCGTLPAGVPSHTAILQASRKIPTAGSPAVFVAFGAGFHRGAIAVGGA